MGNKQASDTNRMMDQSINQYNQARTGYQDLITGGLGGAQSNADAAFNAALQGYQGLLGQNRSLANQAVAAGGQAAQNIMGMGGPGNPWAGQLGRDIRARGNSILPAMYDRIREEQTRLQNLQGGYNPGYAAQMSKLARDQARSMSENVLNTEVELGEKIAAARAAQAAFGLQQQAAAARARQGGFGSASGFGRNSLAALQGIYNLRGQTPGEVQMYLNAGLGNLGAGQQLENQSLMQKMQYNPNVSGWQKALGIMGGLAGAASPFFMPKPPSFNFGGNPYGPGMYGQQ